MNDLQSQSHPQPAPVLGLANMVTGYVTHSCPPSPTSSGSSPSSSRPEEGARRPRRRRSCRCWNNSSTASAGRAPPATSPTGPSATCASSSTTGTRCASASAREVEEALADLPEAEVRAERLISFLQEVFETDFSFDLEGLRKKGLKEAAKQLAKLPGGQRLRRSPGWCSSRSGGHAIPLDVPTLRRARRLGLIDGDPDDVEAARSSLEHLVPKAKGAQFCDLVSNLAGLTCWEDEPHCSACPLASDCPTAQELERAAGVAVGGRAGRSRAEARVGKWDGPPARHKQLAAPGGCFRRMPRVP